MENASGFVRDCITVLFSFDRDKPFKTRIYASMSRILYTPFILTGFELPPVNGLASRRQGTALYSHFTEMAFADRSV